MRTAWHRGSWITAHNELRQIFAGRVYRGDKLLFAIAGLGRWTIEIVTRSQRIGTFKAVSKDEGQGEALRGRGL